jgi:hypothetical protein
LKSRPEESGRPRETAGKSGVETVREPSALSPET